MIALDIIGFVVTLIVFCLLILQTKTDKNTESNKRNKLRIAVIVGLVVSILINITKMILSFS